MFKVPVLDNWWQTETGRQIDRYRDVDVDVDVDVEVFLYFDLHLYPLDL